MLGLRFCARAFSSCGERGPLFIAVRGPFTVAASLVAGHRLQTRRLSSCGSWAKLLRGMWDLPRPGLEPVSPALAGRFSTTAPPGKPLSLNFYGAFWNAEDFKHLCVKLSASCVFCFWCCEFARAVMTKYCRPSGLNNTDLLPHSSGGGKSEIKVLAGLAK